MKVILITPPENIENEYKLINMMFEKGLPVLHLRKPGFDIERMSEYLSNIRQEYHTDIVIHSCYDLMGVYNLGGIHITGINCIETRGIIPKVKKQKKLSVSISYHSFEELYGADRECDYVFLSPVFDSISKRNYKSRFILKELSCVIKKINICVFAVGGCSVQNMKVINELGFTGAAFLGAVWNSSDPVNSLMAILEKAREL